MFIDRVQSVNDRQRLLEQVQCTDGAMHPCHGSERGRYPTSDAEKTWLFDYFSSAPLTGNYYRYDVIFYVIY